MDTCPAVNVWCAVHLLMYGARCTWTRLSGKLHSRAVCNAATQSARLRQAPSYNEASFPVQTPEDCQLPKMGGEDFLMLQGCD